MLPDVRDTIGAAFIGVIIATSLYGVSCVQAWYYFTNQIDQWPIKLLVVSVLLFDTIHQVLIVHAVYTYAITDWGNAAILEKPVWSLILQVMFNGFTAFFVQSFLAIRVWLLSNNVALIFALALLVVVCVLVYTVQSLHFDRMHSQKNLSITICALAAAGDILIAASLCTILHFCRTGSRKSDTMINNLILFSVNTGLLTSLCAVASLIFIIVADNTFINIAVFFCLGKLYTNSLLATLNAREKIRSGRDSTGTLEIFSMFREFPKLETSTDPESFPSRMDDCVDRRTSSNLPFNSLSTNNGAIRENDRGAETNTE